MTLEQIKQLLDAEPLGSGSLDAEITGVSASDLLSDVLAFTPVGALLLTGLVAAQAVRTADLVEASAVCFVAGMRPQSEALEMAKAMSIPLLCTRMSMFEACGRLYGAGLRDGRER